MTFMFDREILATAAQLVVDEGMEYFSAKRKALKRLGLPERTPLPDNDALEEAVREHILLFHADTQPKELAALRVLALDWMRRLHAFRPHLSGAVWHGTATVRNDIHLQLFCDDGKSVEIELINQGESYDVSIARGFHGREVDVLSLPSALTVPSFDPLAPTTPKVRTGCATGDRVMVHLAIHDLDDLRGAVRPDSKGRSPRGDMRALLALVNRTDSDAPRYD